MSPTPTPKTAVPRILIVDDEVHNRRLLEVMLSPEGFDVVSADSGEAAMAMVAARAPDLILLDLLMPGLDGCDVVDRLKGNPATKHIPIVMISALGDRDAKMGGLRAGAEDYLTKPVDRAELCMRVRNLLRLKVHADVALAGRDHSMGMVGHELNNLINGIVVEARLLAEEAPDSADGRRTGAAVARIERTLGHMARLVGDLVDVVSIETGKLAVQLAPGDAAAMLPEIVAVYAQSAAGSEITLGIAPGAATIMASFDHGRLTQVFANLVSNAMKFTPRGGTITLRCDNDGDNVHFSVRDTGGGISASMIDSVFERFWQGSDHYVKGLGLGLYISRCIVESHHGRMWVDSVVGGGSTFHFTIPREPQAPLTTPAPTTTMTATTATMATATPLKTPVHQGHVLVVDDDAAMCETLTVWLRRRGWTATARTAPEEVLALLASGHRCDVVVTDLHMAAMDGLELCARITAAHPGIGVIVTTAFGGNDVKAKAFAAGACDFIAKPYDLMRLNQAIQQRLTRNDGAPAVASPHDGKDAKDSSAGAAPSAPTATPSTPRT